MISSGRARAAVLALTLAATGAAACESSSRSLPRRSAGAAEGQAEADLIRATERERLRALVEADVARARQLHADDFQLINPLGEALSKEQYLGGIGSGEIDYVFGSPTRSLSVSTTKRRSSATRRISKLSCRAATSHASGIGTPTSMNGEMGSGRSCGRRRPRSGDFETYSELLP